MPKTLGLAGLEFFLFLGSFYMLISRQNLIAKYTSNEDRYIISRRVMSELIMIILYQISAMWHHLLSIPMSTVVDLVHCYETRSQGCDAIKAHSSSNVVCKQCNL